MTPETATLQLDGKDYVIVPREDYERMAKLARAAELPPLPAPDEHGHYPAVEYARASLARKIIRDRVRAGLSQKELATRAGISVENLCRIETGKHTPNVATVTKIDRALKQAVGKRRKTR